MSHQPGRWAALGASLVLIAIGLRQQWRGSGLRPWLAVLAVTLLGAASAATDLKLESLKR